jgi:hypothetical protein
MLDIVMEPGFRESEEDESTLSVVLDSLIPFIRDTNTSIKLPTYMGKAIIDPSSDSGEILLGLIPRGMGKNLPGQEALA